MQARTVKFVCAALLSQLARTAMALHWDVAHGQELEFTI